MRFRFLFVLGAFGLAACTGHPGLRAGGNPSLKLADAAMQGDAPGMALRVADVVLKHHPESVSGLVHQGAALAALGRTSEAALSYQRALALRPASHAARIGLGRLRLKTDPAQAEALFGEVLRAHPEDVTALTDRGVALDLEGRHDEAQSSYRKALARQPDCTAAEVDLALSLALAGQARQAVGMLQPLVDGPGSNRRVKDDFAVALAMNGNTNAASEILASSLSRGEVTAAINAYQALDPRPRAAPEQALPGSRKVTRRGGAAARP